MSEDTLMWAGFLTFVFVMLAIDLGIFHRTAHAITIKEALRWTAVWVTLALLFAVGVYFKRGPQDAKDFLAGYVLEQSLSVDNLFVFILIFQYFKVSPMYQHKILFWGILGALVMRAAFIFAGVLLIQQFQWMTYIFGGLLLVSGVGMIKKEDEQLDPEKNPVLRIFRKFMPVTNQYDGSNFFTRKNGRLFATPMMVVLLIVETTDLIFAVDSVPAILGITQVGFIVFTSNVFAILGLRSLFFALSGIMQLFHYLKYGLALILVFIGTKMILHSHYPIDTNVALGVVGGLLAVSVLLSVIYKQDAPERVPASPVEPIHDSLPEIEEPPNSPPAA